MIAPRPVHRLAYLLMSLTLSLLLVFPVWQMTRAGRPGVPDGDRGSASPLLGESSQALLELGPDAVWTSICQIQGAGFSSPYAGQSRRIRGVVYADFDQTDVEGFYIQDATCDANPATSDGLFVYLGAPGEVVQVGDLVQVDGLVQEYFGHTELVSSPAQVTLLAAGQPVPAPAEMSPPFDNTQARRYYEAHEGMRVSMTAAQVVGPTNRFGQTWVVREDLGLTRVFSDDPAGTGEILAVDGDGLYAIQPPVAVGERVSGLDGALSYTLGEYRLHLISPPEVLPATRALDHQKMKAKAWSRSLGSLLAFEVATFNLQNLFDTVDDPAREDPLPSPAAYQRQLEKLASAIHESLGEPLLIGVQEVENDRVIEDLLVRPEIEADYGYVWLDGPDGRGIDVALLYQLGRVRVLEYSQHQGCTSLVDGLGPDGNRDIENPQNAQTCDTDGDGQNDGNRLFSRPPLAVRLRICAAVCQLPPPATPESFLDVWLIVNHWKSKTQDSQWVEYTLPRRIQQAEFTVALAQAFGAAYPGMGMIVLGDLNDTPPSIPITHLKTAGLYPILEAVERDRRYTYIYRGISQVLDYIMVDTQLARGLLLAQVSHINADYPAILADVSGSILRSSDHEPVLADFAVLPHTFYLPVGIQDFSHMPATE